MWRSGSVKTGSEPAERSVRRRRIGGPYRLVFSLSILVGMVVIVFPILFRPGVEPVNDLQYGSPFAVTVQISNQSLTPLMDVEYSCEVSRLTLANGTEVRDAKVVARGAVRRMTARRMLTAHCETAYIVNAPVRVVEYKLTLSYRSFPWPQRRTGVYYIGTEVSGKGQITGWQLH